jgi:hypothetical protein
MLLRALKNLKHLVGFVGILIMLDFFLFDGYCTQACSEALSQASSQMLSTAEQIQNISLSQFIHKIL